MKNKSIFSITAIVVTTLLCGCSSLKTSEYGWVKNGIETSHFQLNKMAADLGQIKDENIFPRTIKNGEVYLVPAKDWTSGFYPGSLWLGYELTGDKKLSIAARRYTNALKELQFYKKTHDLGFMVFCSYGNALRLAPQAGDDTIIVNASKSLASRFSPVTNTIRSWDFGQWSYPVIIDNMMNLEMLFWAAKEANDTTLYSIATRHADATMKNHFRPDNSSFHVVSYVPATGNIESQGTFQGYADNSAWARGQAWGLYGYTVCYRETKDPKYLQQAQHIAQFIMTNTSIPEDLIPYWDYDAPNIPNAPRDVSAAAITASALLELGRYVQDSQVYYEYAEKILKSLSSKRYLAGKGENKGFILMHSVGHFAENTEVDAPLNYADYYYLEAMKRYIDLKKINLNKI